MFKTPPRQIQQDESMDSGTSTRCPPCCLGSQRETSSGLKLPEEIWCHIHSLLSLKDAARFACVSPDFTHSWRFRPNLIFNKETLGLNQNKCWNEDQMRDFTNIVDSILKSHSGIGVKTLKFDFGVGYVKKDCCYLDHLDSWLQILVKPGIEELELCMSSGFTLYNFPVSLLSGGIGASLRSFALINCKFQPNVGSDCFRSLTTLRLYGVSIEDDALSCLLSNTPALERLDVRGCNKLICIRIPCLQQLSHLAVSLKRNVQSIENKAQNLSTLYFEGEFNAKLPPGGTLQIKKLNMVSNNATFNVCTELPSIMPNLETLTVHSFLEEINTPMSPNKFLHLKFLSIFADCGRTYDFLSLVSFLHACPSLETFILKVFLSYTPWVSIFADPSDLHTMPVYHHEKLKNVHMDSFVYAKKYIDFTRHILQSAKSLERLTLDTIYGTARCCISKTGKCGSITRETVMSSRKSTMAIERYIKPKAPSTVLINVLGPCSRCHADLL